ncbi:MAG: hypothetical protein GXX96_23045 [Planctomycetaceae bacterium]|nr:hypothetical protein [Planctomycetaceae bacterium]
MRSTALPTLALFLLLLPGCLEFGPNISTTSPAPEQIEKCRSIMHLRADAEIHPLGLDYTSGPDDSACLKFTTPQTDVAALFDPEFVDVSGFQEKFDLLFDTSVGRSWWDPESKPLRGAQISLPNAEFMNIGIREEEQGLVVYIMWTQT